MFKKINLRTISIFFVIAIVPVVGFLFFQNFIYTSVLPSAVSGAWGKWENVVDFSPSSVNSGAIYNLYFKPNGSVSTSAVAVPSMQAMIAMHNPGALLPTEQCDYRLKFTDQEGQYIHYTASQSVDKDSQDLKMVFSESDINGFVMLNTKNIKLIFKSSGTGQFYNSLKVVYDSSGLVGGVSMPASRGLQNPKYILQRRCFIEPSFVIHRPAELTQ